MLTNNMKNKKIEKICAIILSITGLVLITDVFLYYFYSIGTKQNNFTIAYCIGFILTGSNFPKIFKKKYVVYPLYIMIAQTIYSLMNKYF